MTVRKYPNWDFGYRDFIGQYKPDIVIDRTSIVEVGDKYVIETITEENDEGEEVVVRTKYSRIYYAVGPDEKFSANGTSKTLPEWKWNKEEPADNPFIVIENWMVMNSGNGFSGNANHYGGSFSISWWADEGEPSFDVDFRVVLVVSVSPLPGKKIDTNITPGSRVEATKGILRGLMQSTFSDSGRVMKAGSIGTISYDGSSDYFVGSDNRNNIANPDFVMDEYGLDMPDINDNSYDQSDFEALPYPTIMSGMKATFPGYKYIGDPEISFGRTQIWWGINKIPDLDFSSQVGQKINARISTEEDLSNMRYGYGMTFELTEDISVGRLPTISNFWNTVINSQHLYYDYYDWSFISLDIYGNGHKLIAKEGYTSSGGLFHKFSGGTIRDIRFEGFNIVDDDNVGLVIDKVNYAKGDSVIDSSPTKLENIHAVDCSVECTAKYDSSYNYITSVGAGGLIGTINTTSWGEN